MLTACGDDEIVQVKPAPSVAEKPAPKPVVREWYPTPKHLRPQTVYVPVPLQQPMTQTQPYNTVPYPQSFSVQQVPQGSVTWPQAAQQQEFPQQPQPVLQFQYTQRPWDTPHSSNTRQKGRAPRQTTQTEMNLPYGAWPQYGSGITSWGAPLLGPGLYSGYADPWGGGYPGGVLVPW